MPSAINQTSTAPLSTGDGLHRLRRTRVLGKRDLKVSVPRLGFMGMTWAYDEAGDRGVMIKLLSDAVELGVTFVNTEVLPPLPVVCTI